MRLDPYDKFGHFQTAGICLLVQIGALASLFYHNNAITLFLVIYCMVLFWGALFGKWSIKDLL